MRRVGVRAESHSGKMRWHRKIAAVRAVRRSNLPSGRSEFSAFVQFVPWSWADRAQGAVQWVQLVLDRRGQLRRALKDASVAIRIRRRADNDAAAFGGA